MSFDPLRFRQALSQFPTGVTVVTTQSDKGEPLGVTVSSFNSVSLSPPLILWSIDKSAYSAGDFINAGHFAVNVLSDLQVDVSNRFAGRSTEKFADFAVIMSANDCVLIPNAIAHFECRQWAIYDGGDHHIIVGEVISFDFNDEQKPILFSQGRYGVTQPMGDPRA